MNIQEKYEKLVELNVWCSEAKDNENAWDECIDKVLSILADVFGFEGILLTKIDDLDPIIKGTNVYHLNKGLIRATKRVLHDKQSKDEDILSIIYRTNKHRVVDPNNKSDPYWNNLHKDTVIKFKLTSPILFFPLLYQGKVEGIIHAQGSKMNMNNNSCYYKDLLNFTTPLASTLAARRRLDEARRERFLSEIATKINAESNFDRRVFIMLTAAKMEEGFRFSRAFFFSTDPRLKGHPLFGVMGIGPTTKFELEKNKRKTNGYTIDQYLKNYEQIVLKNRFNRKIVKLIEEKVKDNKWNFRKLREVLKSGELMIVDGSPINGSENLMGKDFWAEQSVLIPLIYEKHDSVGVVIVDNRWSEKIPLKPRSEALHRFLTPLTSAFCPSHDVTTIHGVGEELRRLEMQAGDKTRQKDQDTFEPICNQFAEIIGKRLNARITSIFIYDSSSGHLVRQGFHLDKTVSGGKKDCNFDEKYRCPHPDIERLPKRSYAIIKSFHTRKNFLYKTSSEIASIPLQDSIRKFNKVLPSKEVIKSVLIVPLTFEEKQVGVVRLINKASSYGSKNLEPHGFTIQDTFTLEVIVNQLAPHVRYQIRENQYLILNKVRKEIAKTLNRYEKAEIICKFVVKHLGYHLCVIRLKSGEQFSYLVHSASIPDEKIKSLEIIKKPLGKHSLSWSASLKNDSQCYSNIDKVPSKFSTAELKRFAKQNSYLSIATIPILASLTGQSGSECVGSLVVHSKIKRQFDRFEQEILLEMATILSKEIILEKRLAVSNFILSKGSFELLSDKGVEQALKNLVGLLKDALQTLGVQGEKRSSFDNLTFIITVKRGDRFVREFGYGPHWNEYKTSSNLQTQPKTPGSDYVTDEGIAVCAKIVQERGKTYAMIINAIKIDTRKSTNEYNGVLIPQIRKVRELKYKIIVPLKLGNRVEGVLIVYNDTDEPFGIEQLEVFLDLSPFMAMVLRLEKRLDIMAEVGRVLNEETDQERILELFLQNTKSILPPEGFEVSFVHFDTEFQDLIYKKYIDYLGNVISLNIKIPKDKFSISRYLLNQFKKEGEQGKKVVIWPDDFPSWKKKKWVPFIQPNFKGRVIAETDTALICHKEFLGVLCVTKRSTTKDEKPRINQFSVLDKFRVQSIGDHLASCLYRLKIISEQKREEISKLRAIDKFLEQIFSRKSIPIETMHQSIVSSVNKLINGAGCSLFLRLDYVSWDTHEDKDRFVLVATTGLIDRNKNITYQPTKEQIINQCYYNSGEGLTGWVAKYGVTLRINKREKDYLSLKRRNLIDLGFVKKIGGESRVSILCWKDKVKENTPISTESSPYLAVPVKLGNEVIAVIRVSEINTDARMKGKMSFTEFDERVLELCSRYILSSIILAHRLIAYKETAEDVTRELGHALTTRVGLVEASLTTLENKVGKKCKKYLVNARDAVDFLKHAGEISGRYYQAEKTNLKKRIDIAFLLDKIIKGLIKDKRIKWKKPKQRYWVLGNEGSLENVFFEMLVNSCEFTDHKNGQINLHVRKENMNCIVDIIDNGPGIHPSLRGRLFNLFAFYPEDRLGIALAMSKRIVEKHGGSICETNPKRGAHFRVTLPLIK